MMRHQSKYFQADGHYLQCCNARTNAKQGAQIVTNHITGHKATIWPYVRAFHNEFIGFDAMFATSIREPAALLCSSFQYWPINKKWNDAVEVNGNITAFCLQRDDDWCLNRWLEDFEYKAHVDPAAAALFIKRAIFPSTGPTVFDWIGVLERW